MRVKDVQRKVDMDRSSCYSVKTNVTLLKSKIELFDFPLEENYFELLSEHGPAVATLCSRLAKVRGVDQVFVSTYEITVHMGGLNEVTNDIRKIVNDFIDLAAIIEEVTDGDTIAALNYSMSPDSPLILDFNFEITKKPFRLSRKHTDKNLSGLNTSLKKFLKDLVAIEGVTEIEVSYYKITINQAPLFDKIEIGKKVVDSYIAFVG